MEENKNSLELEKLRLEIRKLGIPWYRNIEFWKVFIPTIAVLASLYFTFGRGIVDAQKERLGIQKEQLKLEITQFEIKKSKVKDDLSDVELELKNKELELFQLNDTLKDLSEKVSSYQRKVKNYETQLNNLKSTLDSDRKFYTNQLVERYRVENAKKEEELNLLTKVENLELKLAAVEAEKEYYANKSTLTEGEQRDLELLLLDTKSSFNLAKIDSLDNLMKSYEEESDKIKERIDTLSSEELMREFQLFFIKEEAKEK